VCKVQKSWKKEGARTLRINAVARVTDGPNMPLLIPIDAVTSSGKTRRNPPFDLVLQRTAKVRVQAPSDFRVGSETWVLVGWSVLGHRFEQQHSIILTLDEDTTIIANYESRTSLASTT